MENIEIGQTVWVEVIKNRKSTFTKTEVKWKGNGVFKTKYLSHRSFHNNGAVVYDRGLMTSNTQCKVHFTNPE